jgi:uracil-DNA glycosylase family 4
MSENSDAAWRNLNSRIVNCTDCARLIAHCQTISRDKRAAYRDWDYWGKPVPNMGDAPARLLLVGLAPGAHGSNRTGRMFTGDASGDWLFRALHKAGFATLPHATDRNDGLQLVDCAITAVAHCAPPDNKPTTDEISTCRTFLEATFDASQARVYLALGGVAWREMFRLFRKRGWHSGPTPKFRHNAAAALSDSRWALASYHPSRQNTNTGRLTEKMLDQVFEQAKSMLNGGRRSRRQP